MHFLYQYTNVTAELTNIWLVKSHKKNQGWANFELPPKILTALLKNLIHGEEYKSILKEVIWLQTKYVHLGWVGQFPKIVCADCCKFGRLVCS